MFKDCVFIVHILGLTQHFHYYYWLVVSTRLMNSGGAGFPLSKSGNTTVWNPLFYVRLLHLKSFLKVQYVWTGHLSKVTPNKQKAAYQQGNCQLLLTLAAISPVRHAVRECIRSQDGSGRICATQYMDYFAITLNLLFLLFVFIISVIF